MPAVKRPAPGPRAARSRLRSACPTLPAAPGRAVLATPALAPAPRRRPAGERVPGRAGQMYAPDEDSPTWFGRETGWWHPSPDPATPQRRHTSIAPFITSSPLIGVGFGVAAAGTIQLGTPETTPLSTF